MQSFQKFTPLYPLINEIIDICYSKIDPYINAQYDLDSSIVTQTILSSEEQVRAISKTLTSDNLKIEITEYINNLSSEDKFLVYVCLQASRILPPGSMQKIPLFPTRTIYARLFSYVFSAFYEFEEYCQKQHLDLWEQILDYELDSFLSED